MAARNSGKVAGSDLGVEIFEVVTSLGKSASYGEAGEFIANWFLENARRCHTKEGEE